MESTPPLTTERWTDNPATESPTVYIASRTKHADKWIRLKTEGENIISSWIYKVRKEQFPDLSKLITTCITEASQADFTIVYSEKDDLLKCALVEAGAALAAGKKVIIVGNGPSITDTLRAHPNCINTIHSVFQAFRYIKNAS